MRSSPRSISAVPTSGATVYRVFRTFSSRRRAASPHSICPTTNSATRTRSCQALRGNASLTSLDVRFVNGMDKLYGMLRDAIAQKDTPCRVGYLRCDAFDVLEGARVLNLKEKALGSAEMRLLLSLLRHNSAVRELDLTATDMDGEGAAALVEAIGESRKLTSVKAAYNPLLTTRRRRRYALLPSSAPSSLTL